jgi:hypothetical protein
MRKLMSSSFPSFHRASAAERVIRTFKTYFIVDLCGTDLDFHTVALWDHLVYKPLSAQQTPQTTGSTPQAASRIDATRSHHFSRSEDHGFLSDLWPIWFPSSLQWSTLGRSIAATWGGATGGAPVAKVEIARCTIMSLVNRSRTREHGQSRTRCTPLRASMFTTRPTQVTRLGAF